METLDAGTVTAEAKAPAKVEAVVAATFPDVTWTPAEVAANRGWAALTAGSLLFVFCFLRFMPSVAWPLVLAGIFAYLFDPLVSALAGRRLSRTAATAIVMASLALLGLGLFATVVPIAIGQARELPAYLADSTDRLVKVLVYLRPLAKEKAGMDLPENIDALTHLASENVSMIASNVVPKAGDFVGKLATSSLSLLSFVLSALIIPIVLFYLLRGWPNVVAGANELVPVAQRPTVTARMQDVNTMLGGFVRGQLTMAAVLSFLYSTGLSVIGVKAALVIGLVTGFGNLIPYVGLATGFSLAAGFTLFGYGFDWHIVAVVLLYAGLLAADGIFLTPRIVGDKVGLSPAAVIVAVLACGSLFGFAGVLLAVPSAAILKLVLKVSVNVYRHTRFYRGE